MRSDKIFHNPNSKVVMASNNQKRPASLNFNKSQVKLLCFGCYNNNKNVNKQTIKFKKHKLDTKKPEKNVLISANKDKMEK